MQSDVQVHAPPKKGGLGMMYYNDTAFDRLYADMRDAISEFLSCENNCQAELTARTVTIERSEEDAIRYLRD